MLNTLSANIGNTRSVKHVHSKSRKSQNVQKLVLVKSYYSSSKYIWSGIGLCASILHGLRMLLKKKSRDSVQARTHSIH